LKTLYIDIEVSPNIALTWATGYKLTIPYENVIEERKIICICWKWDNDTDVSALTWDAKQNDKHMLKTFSTVASEADIIIGHNADRFDIKWVRTRCMFHRIPFPNDFRTCDTLKAAKSNFYFNSNRLDYIDKYLGGTGKKDTGGFELWKAVLIERDPAALTKMVDYCKQDVLILESVHKEMYNYIRQTFHVGAVENGYRWSCPHCGSMNVIAKDKVYSAVGIERRRMKCKDCDRKYTIAINLHREWLEWKDL
jgi:DNA polymerase elongation subunit (family B)